MEPDRTAIGEKKKRRAPRAILWLLGIPGDLIIIIIGVYPFTINTLDLEAKRNEIMLIGATIAILGLLALWLNILLIKLDFKRKQEVPWAIILLFFAWMAMAKGMALYFSFRSAFPASFWDVRPFPTAWAAFSIVLFFGGLFRSLQAVRGSKRFAMILGGLLLILIISTTATLGYVAQHKEHQVYSGSCRDNLRTIDSAIMQYAAATGGVYPQSMDDLMGTYIRAPFPEPYGGFYYLDPPGQNSTRAYCSKGHTY
jgi:hypothetical protein